MKEYFVVFLQKYIPKKFAVSEGFIIDEENNPSGQCDIIIWSHLDYAPYYLEDNFAIVPSHAVKVVIEVKTNLGKDTIVDSYKNLFSVRQIGSHIYTAVFAFESISLRKVVEYIVSDIDVEMSNSVNSIHAMQGWVLQMSKDIPDDEASLVLMETRQEHLQSFLDPLALSIILPPTEHPIAHGLTEFLAHTYINLELQGMEMPFHAAPGPYLNGYLFPGRGIQIYDDFLDTGVVYHRDPRDGLIKDKMLEDFLQNIDNHMRKVEK